jgi:integrase
LERTLADIVSKVINPDRTISGLNSEDFQRLRKRFATKKDGSPASPATMRGHVRRTKLLFSWLHKEGRINRLPAYGAKFGTLTKRQEVQAENAARDKHFTCEEIHQLLNACGSRNYRLKAMIYLGLNCAMGPRDIAELTFDQIDLDKGWLDGSRSKIAVRRCCKLWPGNS